MSDQSEFRSLDQFIVYGQNYAESALKETGEVTAAFIILAESGSVVFLPAQTANDNTKTASAKVANLLCVAYAATAALFVGEAWMSTEATATASTPLSRAADRQEVVIVSAEGFGARKQKILPVMRNESQIFLRFGAPTLSEAAEGRSTHILPDEPATPELQARAQQLLAAMKIKDHARIIPGLSWLDLYK